MKMTNKRLTALWTLIALAAAVLTTGAVSAQSQGKKLDPNQVAKVKEALPEKAPAKPEKDRKVLIFDKCEGFYHDVIPLATKALELLGEKTGAYTADVSSDYSVFTAENLKKYDAIIFQNTTRLKLADTDKRKAIMDFIKGGKGIVGVHAATDNFYDWPDAAAMMGGLFDGHPWTAGGTWAFKLDEPDHPLLKSFDGKGFEAKDEIYQFKDPYTRDDLRVLITLDMDKEQNQKVKGVKRTDGDFAVSWVRPYGKGRVFYCSLGHNAEIFWTKPILEHYLAGIQYALGDYEVPDEPVK